MPVIIRIAPKDIFVNIEMSLKEIKMLHQALAIATIDYDGNIEKEKEAATYAKSTFYPFLDDLLEDIRHGP